MEDKLQIIKKSNKTNSVIVVSLFLLSSCDLNPFTPLPHQNVALEHDYNIIMYTHDLLFTQLRNKNTTECNLTSNKLRAELAQFKHAVRQASIDERGTQNNKQTHRAIVNLEGYVHQLDKFIPAASRCTPEGTVASLQKSFDDTMKILLSDETIKPKGTSA